MFLWFFVSLRSCFLVLCFVFLVSFWFGLVLLCSTCEVFVDCLFVCLFACLIACLFLCLLACLCGCVFVCSCVCVDSLVC